MAYRFVAFACVAIGATTVLAGQELPVARLAEPPAGYRVVWADEFDVDGPPDPARWTFEEGLVRNREHQWYQPQNARVESGLLVIEGRRESRENPAYDPASTDWPWNQRSAEYTSSSMTTKNLAAWRYGYFEARARIDVRSGLWPAWWFLGESRDWPHSGEIDVLEYFRGMLLSNAAWGGPSARIPIWDEVRTPITSLGSETWADDFHIWRMLWDEQKIVISIDGRVLNEIDLSQTVNRDGSGFNPFHQAHYMIVNLALGGTNGGDLSATAFPARFEVDYIRVYQRAQ